MMVINISDDEFDEIADELANEDNELDNSYEELKNEFEQLVLAGMVLPLPLITKEEDNQQAMSSDSNNLVEIAAESTSQNTSVPLEFISLRPNATFDSVLAYIPRMTSVIGDRFIPNHNIVLKAHVYGLLEYYNALQRGGNGSFFDKKYIRVLLTGLLGKKKIKNLKNYDPNDKVFMFIKGKYSK